MARPEVRALFQEIIDRINAGFGRVEQIKKFTLLPHELTQEAGELTPTLKIKRRVIAGKYESVINLMYEE